MIIRKDGDGKVDANLTQQSEQKDMVIMVISLNSLFHRHWSREVPLDWTATFFNICDII